MSQKEIRLYLPHEVLIGLPFFRSKPMYLRKTSILRGMVTEVLSEFGFNIDTSNSDKISLGISSYDIDRLSSVCIYGSDIVFNALQEFRDHLNGDEIVIEVFTRADLKMSFVDNIIVIKRKSK